MLWMLKRFQHQMDQTDSTEKVHSALLIQLFLQLKKYYLLQEPPFRFDNYDNESLQWL